MHNEKHWAGRSTSWNQDLVEISITSDMQMTPLLWKKVKRPGLTQSGTEVDEQELAVGPEH